MASKDFGGKSGYTTHNSVRLIRGGKEYFELLLRLIGEAKQSIHLHVYIFDEDETGTLVADALIDAALRKVEVYLLFDGYASQNLSESFIRKFFLAGIRFRMFEPLFLSTNFYFGRRMHHKVFVADTFHSLVGGINISNKYNKWNDDPPWLDWALYATGDISVELLKILVRVWSRSHRQARNYLAAHPPPGKVSNQCLVRIRRNDWVDRKIQITSSYFQVFRKAKSHITIMSSYFLPGLRFRQKMISASKRGVKIRLILAGTSDIKIAKHAERYIYRWLFKHNIEIFEYHKSVLHGKIATADNEWVTIGSYNVNNISAFASLELNLDVLDKPFARSLTDRLNEIIEQDCRQVTEADFNINFSIRDRLLQWTSYGLVRVLFYLFTFYFRQRSANKRLWE